jgi:predicted enzyme related to lactoylglutathione lyase
MWQFGDNMGGGIRTAHPPEMPGSVPYCEVPDIREAYDRATAAGAAGLMPPSEIPGDNGWIAIVSAPGGVRIGLWAPK